MPIPLVHDLRQFCSVFGLLKRQCTCWKVREEAEVCFPFKENPRETEVSVETKRS